MEICAAQPKARVIRSPRLPVLYRFFPRSSFWPVAGIGHVGAMRTVNRKRKGKVAAVDQKRTSQGRHEYRCTICTHAQRDEIEQEFVNWVSPERIGKHYGVSRSEAERYKTNGND